MHSFYLPPDKWLEPYSLVGGEAHHLSRVLRVRSGEIVRVFDGQGREGEFEVMEVGKHHVALNALDITVHPPRQRTTVLALAWAKALRRSWLLEKAVELEAAALWFWQAERSQGWLPEDVKETWQMPCIAGAKQSGNPWLPDLTVIPGRAAGLAERVSEFDHAYILWEDQREGRVVRPSELAASGSALFIAGPEGGFGEQELRLLLDAGCTPVSLGPRVLRWETAALLCLGLRFWAGATESV